MARGAAYGKMARMETRSSGLASPAWARFRANRRGWWSLWIFAALYAVSLCAGLVSRESGGAFPIPPIFKSGPHTIWDAGEIEPYLRPVKSGGGSWPVAAAQFARGDDGSAVLVRAWGDADKFSAALSGGAPAALRPAFEARFAGEEADAAEVAENGVSWRLAPAF